MEGMRDFSMSSNGPSSPLPFQFSSCAGVARDNRSDGVATGQHTKSRQIERRGAQAATDAEKLTSEPLFCLFSATDTAGHRTGTAAGRVTQKEAARANPYLQHTSSTAAGMAATGSADLEIAQVPLIGAAANRESNYLPKRLAALLRQKQNNTTRVSSFTQRSRSRSPAGATAPLCGQQQQLWGGHQPEQLRRWNDPQQQQHWWEEHLQHVQKHHMQQFIVDQGQGRFNEERLFQKQKQLQLLRERQDLQREILDLAQKKTNTILFQTSVETTNVSRQTLHRRKIKTLSHSSCKTMKSTQEQVRRRGQWREQHQEQNPVQDERRERRQADKTEEQKSEQQQQQQQRRQQTPSHQLLPFSVQFNANTTHLSRAQHAREECPQKRNHPDKQQEEKFSKIRLLPRYCTLSESERPGTCQQHRQQGHGNCTEEQHQQQHAQQDQAEREQEENLRVQEEECRMRRIHFHHNQQSPFHPYVKCESTMHHTHAAGGRKVLAADPNQEEIKGRSADFTGHVQPVDEEHLLKRAETSVLLAGHPAVSTSHRCYQSTSFPCTAALAEEKSSSAAAAGVKPSASGASVADFVSVGSSDTLTAPVRKLGAAASLAAACQDAHSAIAAVVASSSEAAVVTLGSSTTGSARRTGAEAAPRRKQLSGAQKRKRKRELMAKCRVEQGSLLSFLATTVTSELILNDWCALESQLRDECAYFERLSSSAWNLPAALSPHSSTAADSSPTAAPLSSSDAEDHPVAASDGTQLPMLPILKTLGGKRLNNVAPPENELRQDNFHCQKGQQKRQLGPEGQSGDQSTEELQLLTRLNDESSTETRQQHTPSRRERGDADDRMLQMPTTEAQGSGCYSWPNDNRTVLPIDATDQVSRNLHGSPIVNSFVYNNADCSISYDVRHLESFASGCRSNTSGIVNSSSKTRSSRPNGDVMPQWGCTPIIHRYEGFASSDGRSQVLSGSTTPCSNSKNSTSWEWRTPISSHGTATSTCRTWTDDNEEPIENKDLLSSSAVESGEDIQTQVRETTFASGPESRDSSNIDTVEGDMQPHESHVFLRGTMLQGDYVISAADILKRDSTHSERSSGTIDSYGRVSRPSCEDTSVEEDTVGDEIGCSGGARRVDSTSCHSSSKQSDQWKFRGRLDLQQFSEGRDADFSTRAPGRLAEACCSISRTSSIAKGYCPREKGDLESTWWSSSAFERCSREESNFEPSSLICPRIFKDLLDTSTHDATASARSLACVSKVPSSAVAGVADPLTGGDGPDYSFLDASSCGCSLLVRSEQQQQQQGTLDSFALSVTDNAARPDVEGQPRRDVEAETQLLIKGDSSTMKHSGKGGEDRAGEGSYGTTRRSSAATVVGTTETGPESISTQCNNALEDPIVISRTDKSSSTTGAVTHRRRSLSGDTIRSPANWLNSSTPLSSSAQSRRSTSERHISSEPKSLAGLLAACKELESSPVADDEASTASSSPAPVLQPPPASLLRLHPHCDCKRSNRLSPCASFAEAETIGVACLPACVGRCRLPANLQEQPELLALPQQLSAQQEKLVQQRAVQLQPKQQKPVSLVSEHRQSYQQSMIPSEQQQKTSHGLAVHPQQDAHENLLNRREASTAMHVSEGTRLLMVQQQCRVSEAEAETALYDPALWPPQLSDALRSSLVKRGPVQIVDFDFPRDSTQRRFGRQHYWRTAATGERYWRSWLVYSKSRDAVYCFCCKLYSQLAKSVVSTGFRRWKGAAEVLRSHEQSRDHRTCMLQWKCMCVKVGAEVAFGDLMQLWLPSGLPTASAASLEGTPASTSLSGGTALACVKAADKDETGAAHATETKVHACSPT